MRYVTYDPATGTLTGSYLQDLLPEHEQLHIEVSDGVRRNWCLYRANSSRTDVEMIPPAPPALPTIAEYTVAVQASLDGAAREHHYDDIVSACSYAGAPNPFQAEGIAFVAWRGACWALCYSIMAEVEAGTRAQPTIADLVATLPVFAP